MLCIRSAVLYFVPKDKHFLNFGLVVKILKSLQIYRGNVLLARHKRGNPVENYVKDTL